MCASSKSLVKHTSREQTVRLFWKNLFFLQISYVFQFTQKESPAWQTLAIQLPGCISLSWVPSTKYVHRVFVPQNPILILAFKHKSQDTQDPHTLFLPATHLLKLSEPLRVGFASKLSLHGMKGPGQAAETLSSQCLPTKGHSLLTFLKTLILQPTFHTQIITICVAKWETE